MKFRECGVRHGVCASDREKPERIDTVENAVNGWTGFVENGKPGL